MHYNGGYNIVESSIWQKTVKRKGSKIFLNREFGDFQTPSALVAGVLKSLGKPKWPWTRVLEPTCGKGNFIAGLLELPRPPQEICAFEIQDSHIRKALECAFDASLTRMDIRKANLFNLDLRNDLEWTTKGHLLVVGNPPWVTNSELGSLESNNLPKKINLKGLRGLDARTGKSNFDITEFIWIKLITELSKECPTIALLCKTSVARNVLEFTSRAGIPVTDASIRKIDAPLWFGAAVDACLFRMDIGAQRAHGTYTAKIFENLESANPTRTFGLVTGRLVADVKTYKNISFIDGICPLTWRQGLKHDAAEVMELLQVSSGQLVNKKGDTVLVEADYVYPLLKSSDLFHDAIDQKRRFVILTQRHLGEDTSKLKQLAPKTWSYLVSHQDVFNRRKSSIYREQPPFAVFGIGDYCFSPFRLAVSGLYKIPKFRAVGPIDERPVMFDDTCYYLPCFTAEQAALLASLLNSQSSLELLNSLVFWDSKRPITKKILQRIDLRALFDHVNKRSLISKAGAEYERLIKNLDENKTPTWPESIDRLVEDISNSFSPEQWALFEQKV